MFNKYLDYTEDDFINDPDFQDWVIDPNAEKAHFWEAFFEENPHKKQAAELARKFFRNISFKEDFPEEYVIEKSLAKHLDDIERLEQDKAVSLFPRRTRLFKALRVAAVLAGIILTVSTLLIIRKKDAPVIVKTEFGKVKYVSLPDSSLVVLNANSTIKYSKNWSKSKIREIWLDGEAFFNVRHINADTNNIAAYERFIVHSNDLTIEVLGTSFDIRNRRGKIEVVLEKGKVKVSFKDKRRNDIVLLPGDIVRYDSLQNELLTETINAENFSAWKEKKLLLNNPTVSEIVKYLEDNFGKKIVLDKPELGMRTIEGPILLTNLDDALFILSTVLNTEIIKKDSILIIRSR